MITELEVFVPGHPKTKGSLDVMTDVIPQVKQAIAALVAGLVPKALAILRGIVSGGTKTYVKENVAGSKQWRQLMAYRLRQAWNGGEGDAIGRGYEPREPLAGPVRVSAMFYLPCARGERSLIAQGSGDVDKLARNLLDALADAGVIRNDAQVTGIICDKEQAHALAPQGVKVTVWRM